MLKHIFTSLKIASGIRMIRRHGYVYFFFLLFFQPPALIQAHASPDNTAGSRTGAALPSLPPAYGTVIYSYNETSPNKLYIIGISHRDSRSRLNSCNTVKTQAEVYKIGEWLNRNRNLNLLLPEGFFGDSETHPDVHLYKQSFPLDDTALEKMLADTSHFINAEMLLMQHFHMRACQVENQRLYNAVLNRVVALEEPHDNPETDLPLEMQLDRLQEKRTEAILKNIPTVIETEFHKGRIKNKEALFTIGLNHIATIIDCLKDTRTNRQLPHSASSLQDEHETGQSLKNQDFGIIVIIPHSLVHDREVMRMTNLDSLI